ncbi:MAG: AsmA-like C-terminal domain-containing protein, partial [Pseudomonadota bacterium]
LGIYYFLDLSRQKVFLEKQLTSRLHRPVHIQKAHLQIFPQIQIILNQVEIKEPNGKSSFITIEKLHLGISLKLLLTRTIYVTYCILDHPRITLVRTGSRLFNFSDLISVPHQTMGGEAGKKKLWFNNFRVLLETLIIRKAEVEFKDSTITRLPNTITLFDVDFQTNKISTEALKHFRLKCRLKSQKNDARVSLKGEMGPIPKSFTLAAVKCKGSLEATGVPLSLLWPFLQNWEKIRNPEAILTGAVSFKGILGGNFEAFGKVDFSKVTLEDPEWFENALKIDKTTLDFSLTRDGEKIIVPHITLTLPQGTATGRILVDTKTIPIIQAEGEVKNVNYQSVLPLLPFPLFPRAAKHLLAEVITNGTIENFSFRCSKTLDNVSPTPSDEWLKTMAGNMRFRDVSLKTLDGLPPVQQLTGEIRFEGREVALTNLSGIFGNTAIERGTATLSNLDFLDLSADFNLDLFDLFNLLTSHHLPLTVQHRLQNLNELSGKAKLTLDVSGPVRDLKALTFGGRLELLNANVNYQPFRKVGNNLSGTIHFTPYVITFPNIRGFWAGSPFVCNGEIEDYRTRNSQINVQVASGSALVNDLASAFFPWKGVEGNGMVDITVDFHCQGYRTETLRFDGQAQLPDISLYFPAFPQPFTHISGTMGFSSEGLSFSEVHFQTGVSELTFTGSWNNLRQPKITGNIEGRLVDLLDFYKPRKPEKEKPPPNYTLENIAVRISNSRYKDLGFDNLETTINFHDGILYLPSLKIKSGKYRDFDFVNLDTGEGNENTTITYQNGTTTIPFLKLESQEGFWIGKNITVILKPEQENTFSLTNEIQNIPIENVLEAFTPNMRKLTGTLNLAGHLSGEGENVSERMATLDGEITLTIKKGILKKFNLLSKLFSLLNVSRIFRQDYSKLLTQGLYYDTIQGSFQIENGIARTDTLYLDSSSMEMHAVGDINLGNKTLDLEVAVQPLETVDKIVGKIPLLGTILMGDEGAVVISYYRVTGTFDKPEINSVVFQSLGRKGQGIFRRIFKLPETILNPGGNKHSLERNHEGNLEKTEDRSQEPEVSGQK